MKTVDQHRDDIVKICHLLYQKGWVAANDGNVSVRLDQHRILCTPTNISKGLVHASDLIICDLCGNKLEGAGQRTSEIGLHTTVYALRDDINAVVHAHPPNATGFAVAGRALDKALLPEVVLSLGAIPLARYGLPGTAALTDGMRPLIPDYDAMLMQNHGAVAYAADLWQAFFRMETVEHFAHITFVAELVGGAIPLPRSEVAKLFAARGRYNICSRATMQPGMPLVAEDLQVDQPDSSRCYNP